MSFYVYKIECTINNKVYIGQTNNFKQRWKEHKSCLKRNIHQNNKLQEDYNKYGLINLKFSVIEQLSTRKQSLEKETYWINYYGGKEDSCVYNKSDLQGHNKEYKLNQAKAQEGIHTISKEGKERISKANKGKVISEQQKELIRQAAKLNPNYGMKNKQHKETSKQQMREKKLGIYNGVNNPNFKYSLELSKQLKEEYKICPNYSELGRKHNLKASTVSHLIKRNF